MVQEALNLVLRQNLSPLTYTCIGAQRSSFVLKMSIEKGATECNSTARYAKEPIRTASANFRNSRCALAFYFLQFSPSRARARASE